MRLFVRLDNKEICKPTKPFAESMHHVNHFVMILRRFLHNLTFKSVAISGAD